MGEEAAMKRESILRTGVCYWSDEDDSFVVQSSLFSRTAGVGESPEAAWSHFRIMVDEALDDIRTDGLYESPGRPTKDIVSLNVQCKPETRDAIKRLQRELETSSQGEVLDYLVFFREHVTKAGAPWVPRRGAQLHDLDAVGVAEPVLSIFGASIRLTDEQVSTLQVQLASQAIEKARAKVARARVKKDEAKG